jgi:deazaflavin-dependent oxidoreductase (nitroreductase family)
MTNSPQTNYIGWVPAPGNIKRIGKIHALLYAWTRGLLGGRVDGLDVLLLTTIGRKTRRARCVPLPYFRDGERFLVVASFGGNAANPAWVDNIRHDPEVEVQRGGRRWRTRARIAQDAERERMWSAITHEFPRYAVYQTKTERQIPVIVLDPPP